MAKHCIPDYGKTLLSRRWQDSVIQKMARHGNPEDGKTYWTRQRQNIMKGGMKTSLNWNRLSNVFLQMLQTFLEPWDAMGIASRHIMRRTSFLLQMLQMEQDPGGDDRPPALRSFPPWPVFQPLFRLMTPPCPTPFLFLPFTMFCLCLDHYVLPSSGLHYLAFFWIWMFCHNLEYNVLPTSGLQIWPSSVLPSSGIAKFHFRYVLPNSGLPYLA